MNPINWPLVEIGAICSTSPAGPSAPAAARPTHYIEVKSINSSAHLIVHPRPLSGDVMLPRSSKIVRTGDVLISTIWSGRHVVATVPPHLDQQLAVASLCVLRPDQARLDSAFLRYALMGTDFATFLRERARGTIMLRVPEAVIKGSKILLPPLPVQHALVARFNRLVTFRQRQLEATRRLEDVVPALFIRLFGDPHTNPMHWPVQSLGDLADIAGGSGMATAQEAGNEDDSVPLIAAHHVWNLSVHARRTRIDRAKAEREGWLVPQHSILFGLNANASSNGASVALTGAAEVAADSDVLGFTVKSDSIRTSYLLAWLSAMSDTLRAMAPQIGTRVRLHREQFVALAVPVPPLERQRSLEDYIHRIRSVAERSATSGQLQQQLLDTFLGSLLPQDPARLASLVRLAREESAIGTYPGEGDITC